MWRRACDYLLRVWVLFGWWLAVKTADQSIGRRGVTLSYNYEKKKSVTWRDERYSCRRNVKFGGYVCRSQSDSRRDNEDIINASATRTSLSFLLDRRFAIFIIIILQIKKYVSFWRARPVSRAKRCIAESVSEENARSIYMSTFRVGDAMM